MTSGFFCLLLLVLNLVSSQTFPFTAFQNGLNTHVNISLNGIHNDLPLQYNFSLAPFELGTRFQLKDTTWTPTIFYKGIWNPLNPFTLQNDTVSVNFIYLLLDQPNSPWLSNILIKDLDLDTARVHIIDTNQTFLYGTSSDCYNCTYLTYYNHSQPTMNSFVVETRGFHFNFDLVTSAGNYEFEHSFEDDTHWIFYIQKDPNSTAAVNVTTYQIKEQQRSTSTPLWVAFGIIAFVAIVAWGVTRYFAPQKVALAERLSSLDVFRGLSIVIMVFVNYGGGGYWFFNHSPWDGLTLADVVFPWFMWIMGTSMALSFKNIEITRENALEQVYRVVRRTIILFALGIFVNQNHNMELFRIPGVLQRFAICYFLVSMIILFVPKLKGPQDKHLKTAINHDDADTESATLIIQSDPHWAADIVPYLLQWGVVLAGMALYLFLQFFLPVPGCPTGYIGPGGRGDGGRYPECTGGAHGYIDRKFFGVMHIYQWPTCRSLYDTTVPYDPEGILGVLTSVVIVFLGCQAGRILNHHKGNPKSILIRWGLWGLITGLLALALCTGTKFTGPIPVNKNLWSPSFIFANASTAFFVLSICYILVDLLQIWGGAPFLWVGMNPIFIYVGHETLGQFFPFSWRIVVDTHTNELFMNLVGVTLWCAIAFKMYYEQFFVKI